MKRKTAAGLFVALTLVANVASSQVQLLPHVWAQPTWWPSEAIVKGDRLFFGTGGFTYSSGVMKLSARDVKASYRRPFVLGKSDGSIVYTVFSGQLTAYDDRDRKAFEISQVSDDFGLSPDETILVSSWGQALNFYSADTGVFIGSDAGPYALPSEPKVCWDNQSVMFRSRDDLWITKFGAQPVKLARPWTTLAGFDAATHAGIAVAAGLEGRINVYDVDTRQFAFSWDTGALLDEIAVSSDGNTIATANIRGELAIWDRYLHSRLLTAQMGRLSRLQFVDGDKKIFFTRLGQSDWTWGLIDVATGSIDLLPSFGLINTIGVNLRLTPLQDGLHLVARNGYDMKLVRASDGSTVRTMYGLADKWRGVGTDGRFFVFRDGDGHMVSYDSQSQRWIPLSIGAEDQGVVVGNVYWVAQANGLPFSYVSDLRTGSLVGTIDIIGPFQLSANGDSVYAQSAGVVREFEIPTGRQLRRFVSDSFPEAFDVSAGGDFIVTGRYRNYHVYHQPDGKLIATFTTVKPHPTLRFSPDIGAIVELNPGNPYYGEPSVLVVRRAPSYSIERTLVGIEEVAPSFWPDGSLIVVNWRSFIARFIDRAVTVPGTKASAFIVSGGRRIVGGLSDLDLVDPFWIQVAPDVTTNKAVVAIDGKADAGKTTVTLDYVARCLTTSSPSPPNRRFNAKLEFFDWTKGTYDSTKAVNATLSEDEIRIEPTANEARFLQAGTRKVRVKVTVWPTDSSTAKWELQSGYVRWLSG